jgi:multicomponent Na+:H+ antiporter subunit C
MDLTFILERYNYWIFIVLMMIGLYIVISRGNLVKKIVGLNIFQTSVFIYYISIGKIAGGTAPIIIGDAAHGGEHATPFDPAAVDDVVGERIDALKREESLHATPEGAMAGNELSVEGAPAPDSGESLHTLPQELPDTGNVLGEAAPDDAIVRTPPETGDAIVAIPPPGTPDSYSFVVPEAGHDAAGADLLHQAADIIYSNPLPHVLILTAIVVGVATTAVGLALAVRIREAYGTVEEDELEAADDIAEFGTDFSEKGARA